MNNRWWKNFLRQTDNMKAPGLFPGALQEYSAELKKLTAEVIRSLARERKLVNPRVRLWLDQKRNADLLENIFDNPPLDDDVEKWAGQLFPNQKFGITINDGDIICPELNQKIALLMQSLLITVGIPLFGLNITFFIGNYGFTPFGVHIDQGPNETAQRSVFHFHLGPGTKTIYTWEPEVYHKFSSGDPHYRVQDPTKILPFGKSFTFKGGDLFFLPWSKYHVGYTEEVSIGLTIIYTEDTNIALSKKIFSIMENELVCEKYPEILHPSNQSGNTQDITSNQLEKTINFSDESFGALFKNTFEDYRLQLISNLGFGADAHFNNSSKIGIQDTVKVTAPFKIYYKQTPLKRSATIYGRGQKLRVRPNGYLPDLIDKLNSQKALCVYDLIDPFLSEWEIEEAMNVINFLGNSRAIEVIKEINKNAPLEKITHANQRA